MEAIKVAPYPVPPNEEERLDALYALELLDTKPEPAFDRIANMTARLMDAPIALISLVDRERQWFKAKCGVEPAETGREFSFCTHAMLCPEPMVICDATKDERFCNNPVVTGDMSIRFYVGAPLQTRDGLGLGTLCVVDTVVRERPSQEQLDNLTDLAYLVSQQMELRLTTKAVRANESLLKEAQRIAHVGHWQWDVRTRTGIWSDEAYRLYGLVPQSGISLERQRQLLAPEDRERISRAVDLCVETGEPYAVTHAILRENGSVIHVEERGRLERDGRGRAIKVVGTILDVTARVRTDALLRQSHEELEERVAQRTKLLQQEAEEHRLTQVIVAGQNKVLRKIAEGVPIEQIFEMLVRFGEGEADSGFNGLILLKTDDGERLVWAAAPTLPPEIWTAFPEIRIGVGNGSAGEAAFLKKRVVLTNLDQSAWPGALLFREYMDARSLASAPIFDENHEVLGTVSFACKRDRPTDYELRVQESCAGLAAVALLRDREQAALHQWQQMFQHASWGMALASPKTRTLLAVNPAYAAMLGYAEHELIGKSVFDVFGQAVMSNDLTKADCFTQRISLSYETIWQLQNGNELPVMIDIVQICDSDGRPRYWAANVMDVTERKRVSNELREALRESQVLADLVPQIFWTAQADGWVTYFNEKWHSLTGLKMEESIGWKWAAAIHPDDLKHNIEAWSHSLASGEPYQFEARMKSPSDGTYRWQLSRALPLRSSSGEVVKWFGTSTDIHDQKTENERLESVVEARTEQLRRLLTEKETLLKELHHRVKNNLQVISSLLRMHGEKVRDPGAAAALADSRQRVIAMALIHERLYGSQQMNAIDFGEYTRTLVHELFQTYSFKERNVRSRVEAPRPLLLKIDQAIPCGLILNELVTNALKYAYPGVRGGEVVIELTESQGEVNLAVSDEGTGLPEGWELKRNKSLGLPIVDLLAKQLGGTLIVRTGVGARLLVRFPQEMPAV